MFLKMSTEYKGLSINDAIYTVESITIQGGQLDFFVSMRAFPGSPLIDGDNFGCIYDPDAGSLEEQAYNHLQTLAIFQSSTKVDDLS